jgi:hypothetical protein
MTERLLRELRGKARLGLVTRAQVHAVPATPSWLRSQLSIGRLQQIEADVFVLERSWEGEDFPWNIKALAACLQRGPDARLAFGSAAKVWDLVDGQNPDSDYVHVVVPASRAFRSTERVEVHRSRRLTSSDVTTVGSLPVTTGARTVIDLASSLSPAAVERVVDDALVRGITTVPLLAGALKRNAHRGCRGGPAVREALSLWQAGGVESHAEVAVLRWLLVAGMPAPVRQLVVVLPDGKRLRVDLAWPVERVVLEVDGFAHHHGPRKLSVDHERRSVLTALGWHVLTTTVAEVRRGGSNLLAALRALGVVPAGAGRKPAGAARRPASHESRA